jgi:hypothetical protein
MVGGRQTYLFIRIFIVLVSVVAEFLVFVILVLKLSLFKVVQLLELEGFACEPVDSTGNQLLLNILSELVIQLKTLLNVGGTGFIIGWRLRWGEEVEEGFARYGLTDYTGLLGVWLYVSGCISR